MVSVKSLQSLSPVSRAFVSTTTARATVARRGVATIANFKVPTINNEPNASLLYTFLNRDMVEASEG